MKKMLLVAATIIGAAAISEAAKGTAADPNMEIIKTVVSRDRKSVFQEAMGPVLNEANKDAFWNIYEGYEKEKAALTEQKINLISDYANHYETLTSEQAQQLINKSLSNQRTELKIRQKYAKQISKAINGQVAARFYQVDDLITAAAKASAFSEIPLVGDTIPANQ